MPLPVSTGNTCKSRRLPLWLKKRGGLSQNVHEMKRRLRSRSLHTVCEEARCPNAGECFARGTAAIMILGDRCTRRCGFCAVGHGSPLPPDPDEPGRVAEEVLALSLVHAVITSVTRDDLPDGGASHFAETIRAIRKLSPETRIEVLVPDFEGRERDVLSVCEAGPDIFNHNLETVERLTGTVRSGASYERSLRVLGMAKGRATVKSGLMVGLGETDAEIDAALSDLASTGVEVVTIGQYLPPSKVALPVARYVEPEKFREYEVMGLKHGIKRMFCGPLVRSSYLADKVMV